MGRGGEAAPNIALKRHTNVYTYIYVCIIVSDPAFMQIHVMLLSDRNAASPRKIRFDIFWSQNQKGTIFNCTNQRFPETKIENKKLLLWRRPSSFRIYQKLYYPFSSLRDL